MRPTGWRLLVGCALVAGVLGYLVGELAYGDLPDLPAYAPVTLALLAVVELGMARVVRDRLRGRARPGARVLHPEQIARAAVLARASSPTGALLAGAYAGLLLWLLQSPAADAAEDAPRAAVSALTGAGLVAAALVLERACRLPPGPDQDERRAHRVEG